MPSGLSTVARFCSGPFHRRADSRARQALRRGVWFRGMERLRQVAEAGLGLLLAATPLALWIAWTPALVLGVMLAAVATAALLAVLAESAPRQEESITGVPRLPEEFIEEVHRLFPLTYHHSHRPAARFRETMLRLARMVEGK